MNFLVGSRNCTKCKKLKPLSEFKTDRKGKYGKSARCKTCIQSYNRSESRVIMYIYSHQKDAAKKKGYPLPEYTRQELSDWLYKNGFKEKYDNWVKSNYDKKLYPSVDRIDNYKTYSLDNIRLLTFYENHKNFSEDIKNAVNKGQERCKTVYQYAKDNKLVGVYHSTMEAKRKTNIFHISSCARGKRKYAGQHKWSYWASASDLERAGYIIKRKMIKFSGGYVAEYSLGGIK